MQMIKSEKCVLSVDIGVKNFSYCLLKVNSESRKVGRKTEINSTYEILDWKVINLLDEDTQPCEGIVKSGPKKGTQCGIAHKISVNDENDNTIKHYYCSRHNPDKTKYKAKPPTKVANVLLQDLCINLMKRLNTFPQLKQAHDVVIEQQIRKSPKNIQMGHIVFSYFVIHGVLAQDSNVEKVRFISAKCKYRVYRGPKIQCKLKNAKDQRKWLGVKYAQSILKDGGKTNQKWSDLIANCPQKKDDLADCFLQGMWWIEQRYNNKRPLKALSPTKDKTQKQKVKVIS